MTGTFDAEHQNTRLTLPKSVLSESFAVDDRNDLKINLSALTKKGLLLLAQKYKVKLHKKGQKAQMIESFFNRVPSNLIDALYDEIEKEKYHRAAGRKKAL